MTLSTPRCPVLAPTAFPLPPPAGGRQPAHPFQHASRRRLSRGPGARHHIVRMPALHAPQAAPNQPITAAKQAMEEERGQVGCNLESYDTR